MDWSRVTFETQVPTGRRWHTLVQIDSSSKYVMFGGYEWVYVLLTCSFSGDKKNLHSDLHLLDMGMLFEEFMVFISSESTTWMPLATKGDFLPTPRCKHAMCQISSKEFLLIGGEDTRGSNCQEACILRLGMSVVCWENILTQR
jgi:hypothetical protein